ncbi:hypothetical protein K438DRAFT_1761700 [Mycena galopus ATCC 62051]|nr:hypothetical protein K438DRAFT_1761700 [Mycena galopus ATCC 62051]
MIFITISSSMPCKDILSFLLPSCAYYAVSQARLLLLKHCDDEEFLLQRLDPNMMLKGELCTSRPLRFSSPRVLQANWKLHSNINFGQQNTLAHTRFAEGWKRPKITKSRNWFPFRSHTLHSTLSSVDSPPVLDPRMKYEGQKADFAHGDDLLARLEARARLELITHFHANYV